MHTSGFCTLSWVQPHQAGAQGGAGPSDTRFGGREVASLAGAGTGVAGAVRAVASAADARASVASPTFIRLGELKNCATEHSYLVHASRFVSSYGMTAGQHDYGFSRQWAVEQLRTFETLCVQMGRKVPGDLVGDDPLTFVLRYQVQDKKRRKPCHSGSGLAFLLAQAMQQRNLAVTCKILQGLGMAQQCGRLEEESLYPLHGGLLHSPAFYDASSAWRQLVLGTGIFDLNRLSSSFGQPPLLDAIVSSTESVVDLLEAGADPNIGSRAGDTPLGRCIDPLIPDRMSKLAALLCRPSLDPNLPTADGGGRSSPLHKAVCCGFLDVVARLLAHSDVDANSVFDVRWYDRPVLAGSALTAAVFHILVSRRHPLEMVEELAAAGARLLVVNAAGNIVDCNYDIGQWKRQIPGHWVLPAITKLALQGALERGLHRSKSPFSASGEESS